jgi:hypothetical protein
MRTAPNVTALVSPTCTSVTATSIAGCSRVTSTAVTIIGTNFGPDLPTVLAGSGLCTSVVQNTTFPQRILYCTVSPGTALGQPVLVLQNGGSIGGSASISYAQCAGTDTLLSHPLLCAFAWPVLITLRCPLSAGTYANASSCVSVRHALCSTHSDPRYLIFWYFFCCSVSAGHLLFHFGVCLVFAVFRGNLTRLLLSRFY